MGLLRVNKPETPGLKESSEAQLSVNKFWIKQLDLIGELIALSCSELFLQTRLR